MFAAEYGSDVMSRCVIIAPEGFDERLERRGNNRTEIFCRAVSCSSNGPFLLTRLPNVSTARDWASNILASLGPREQDETLADVEFY
jgi:hypothetical protein